MRLGGGMWSRLCVRLEQGTAGRAGWASLAYSSGDAVTDALPELERFKNRLHDVPPIKVAGAGCELPFSRMVPKTLGAVSITLCCLLRDRPSPLPMMSVKVFCRVCNVQRICLRQVPGAVLMCFLNSRLK
jgi:hypothetical protein